MARSGTASIRGSHKPRSVPRPRHSCDGQQEPATLCRRRPAASLAKVSQERVGGAARSSLDECERSETTFSVAVTGLEPLLELGGVAVDQLVATGRRGRQLSFLSTNRSLPRRSRGESVPKRNGTIGKYDWPELASFSAHHSLGRQPPAYRPTGQVASRTLRPPVLRGKFSIPQRQEERHRC